jgi:hypothetical protein
VTSGFIETGGINYDASNGNCASDCHATRKWSCTACHRFPPDSGSHEDHASFACTICHKEHTHTYKSATAPNDFENVEVNFTISGSWDSTTNTCNSIGCHNDRQW